MAPTSQPGMTASMPPANADLATTWAFLEEGVDHIMTKLQTGVSYSKYMALYTVAYNYCTSSRMHGGAASNNSEMLQGRSMSFQPFCPPLYNAQREQLARISWVQISTTTSFAILAHILAVYAW
jgi:hypothetical protein